MITKHTVGQETSIWYYAQSYPSIEEALVAHKRVSDYSWEQKIRMAVTVLQPEYDGTRYHVCVVYSLEDIFPVWEADIVALMGNGKPYRLCSPAIEQVVHKHLEDISNTSYKPPQTVIYQNDLLEYANWRRRPNPETVQRLRAQHRPCFSIIQDFEHEQLLFQEMPDKIRKAMLFLVEANRVMAQRHIFSQSARNMLRAVLKTDWTNGSLPYPLWVEHTQPDTLIHGKPLLAFEIMPISGEPLRNTLDDYRRRHPEASKNQWIPDALNTIDGRIALNGYDTNLDISIALVYREETGLWYLDDLHMCPWCTSEGDVIANYCVPCEKCRTEFVEPVLCYVATAVAMIHKEYAVAPEEPIFGQRRAHWKRDTSLDTGKPIHSPVEHEAVVSIVHYEVSLKPPRPIEEMEAETHTSRVSWQYLRDSNDIVYRHRHIDAHTRRKPEEMHLPQEQGSIHVKPYDAWIPCLAADAAPWRQVVAHRYQQ